MTAEERKMLEDLAEKVKKTPAPPKDDEAEEFIRKNIGSRPDALYLMTQTVVIQNMALEHAQRQIHELKEPAGEPAPAPSGGSFVGAAEQTGGARFGRYSQSRYTTAAPPPPPPQQAAPSPAPPSPTAGGSFLRGAAQTAAGVAVGALAFEGISAMFSHPMYGGYGFGGYGYMGAPMGETIIENNYYEQPQDTGQTDVQDQSDQDQNDQDQNDQDQNDQDQTDMQDVDDSGQYDDGSNFDDGGGFNDGGGFDDGGGDWT
ncbi:MAG: DUF2076 domain-containing protein [Bryobacteraceae bacterium]